jgi:hypothetical protein
MIIKRLSIFETNISYGQSVLQQQLPSYSFDNLSLSNLQPMPVYLCMVLHFDYILYVLERQRPSRRLPVHTYGNEGCISIRKFHTCLTLCSYRRYDVQHEFCNNLYVTTNFNEFNSLTLWS